jgi:AcrR family transcriptional regulator
VQPTRHRYDAKLATILRKASAVFAEKGYDGASIRDISAATDVSLSGLYYYFKSKEDLLFLIQKHCFDTLIERLAEDLDGVNDPVDRLEGIVRNHLRFFVDNMSEMKVLSHEADALTGEYQTQISARKREYVATVQSCVDQLAPDWDAADRRVATFALFGMMNWIYTWYRPDQDVSVDRLSANILQIFLGGVGAGILKEAPLRGAASAGEKTSMWTDQL